MKANERQSLMKVRGQQSQKGLEDLGSERAADFSLSIHMAETGATPLFTI